MTFGHMRTSDAADAIYVRLGHLLLQITGEEDFGVSPREMAERLREDVGKWFEQLEARGE